MKKILYKFFSGLWYILSLLPLKLLYALSDIAYYFVYYVVRYRRGVVRHNLMTAFPEKDRNSIILIEKEYYSWFCDYIAETIKLASISEEEIARRMKFEGMEEVEKVFTSGRSSFLYLGHYCNWEWITSLPLYAPKNIIFGQIYHVLSNSIMDSLFLKNRERFGAVSIAKENTLRQIINWDRAKKLTITGFISDQVPKWNSIHYWTDFLNHDTPVFTGTERIARKLGYAVFYGDVHRVKRGYYVCRIVKMTDNARETDEFELTEKYMRLLEQAIRQDPPYWLWSHNRWKRTHERFNEMFPDEERRGKITK
jgi:Kdo2-lipid IVA lauroyltransferase/acyltransferase